MPKSTCRWFAHVFYFLSSLFIAAIPAALGQSADGKGCLDSQAIGNGGKSIKFEVVSIRPAKGLGWLSKFSADGYSAKSIPLASFIRLAFYPLSAPQLEGLPPWTSATYDIQAKVGEEDIPAFQALSREQRGKLLQVILQERFKLQCRAMTRIEPVFFLTVATNGRELLNAHLHTGAAHESEGNGIMDQDGSELLDAHPYSMVSLARRLSWLDEVEQRKVVDRTGLSGFYDFKLGWYYKENPEPDSKAEMTGPSLFSAIRQQLGLELESGKAPVDIVVIDHLERPTSN